MNIHERVIQWHTDDGVSLFKRMGLPDDSICLDFGCGYGEYSIAFALAYPNSTVHAIDKNAKVLKVVADKAKKANIENVNLNHADGSLTIAYPGDYADIVLLYDFIHGNTQEKRPIRFYLYEEAKRVLKPNGILSVAPFECENLRDVSGKNRKYTMEMLIAEIEASRYSFKESVDGAVHFDYYHSAYHWKKLNGDMPFDYLEKGLVLNFNNMK